MTQKKKVIHFVLTYHWYDLMDSGEKRIEYRKNTPFWRKRTKDGTHARFQRAFDKNPATRLFKINKIDNGTCPYEDWNDADYIRIHY